MLSKSSVFMMLLIVTASLVGISSIYKPANVETQPQPQPQQQAQNPGQLIVPPGKQPLGNQPLTKLLESTKTVNEDAILVNRILPLILKYVDGKVLAQKILPHLQVTLRVGDNYSPPVTVRKGALAADSYAMAEARCPPGTRVIGGGGQISPGRALPSGLFDFNAADVADNNMVALMIIPTNRLDMVAKMETGGSLLAYATCLNPVAEISIKP
jgi:hypothetical protein